MENNRRTFLILGLVLVLGLIFFLLGSVYLFDLPKRFFWLGCALGAALGVITWAGLLLSWDPVSLSPKIGSNDKAPEAKGWEAVVIIIIMVVAIVIRVGANRLGPNAQTFLMGCGGTWVAWTFSTMMIMAWWYRPK